MYLLSQKSTNCNWYYDLDVFSIRRYHMVSEIQNTAEFATNNIDLCYSCFCILILHLSFFDLCKLTIGIVQNVYHPMLNHYKLRVLITRNLILTLLG